ncbi:MAG: amidohydrolase family protein [Deltaproteobacteria bacterium]|nr:amidohydrolase family protein [Deltaproteobacteria bacterium]
MIIDFHTHIFPPRIRENREDFLKGEEAFKTLYNSPQARLVGAGDLISAMDEADVQKSVVFGFPWENTDYFKLNNDYVIEAVNRYPDRLVGLACFSPFSPTGAREAERCFDLGLSGVGELAVYGDGITAAVVQTLEPVMATCLERDGLFMLHTNEPVGHQYPGKTPNTLRQIYDFVKTYPENRIILAHWGGGLLFYALMKKEVVKVLENVWFDTAASPFLYRPEMYRIAGEVVGFDKILFGSDYPLLKPQRYFKEMEAAGLTTDQMDRIMGLNARNLLA